MAKRALFNVDAVISMLDDPMNDEELNLEGTCHAKRWKPVKT